MHRRVERAEFLVRTRSGTWQWSEAVFRGRPTPGRQNLCRVPSAGHRIYVGHRAAGVPITTTRRALGCRTMCSRPPCSVARVPRLAVPRQAPCRVGPSATALNHIIQHANPPDLDTYPPNSRRLAADRCSCGAGRGVHRTTHCRTGRRHPSGAEPRARDGGPFVRAISGRATS